MSRSSKTSIRVEAWLATRPLENPDAPATPFVLPEYRVAELEAAAALDAGAEGSAVQGKDAIQRSSNYVLSIVLFAAALFLCAIGPRFERPRLRIAVIVLGGAVFALTGIWIATLPVSVSL